MFVARAYMYVLYKLLLQFIHELDTFAEMDLKGHFFIFNRERERTLAQSMAPPILPMSKADMPRFAGGGFNLKQTQKTSA